MTQHSSGLQIRLTRQDMSNAIKAARGRQQLNRASGVTNQKKAGNSAMDIELLGVKAEIAVAKALQCDFSPFDLGIDDGADMWLGGYSIDVKASFHQNGQLLFKSREAFRADCAILAIATDEDDVINIIGGCTKNRFISEAQNADLGRGPCWVMQQANLSPIETVWRHLTQERHK
jgi:hypothetical protein